MKFISQKTKKSFGLKNVINNKIVPFMGKVGNQRHLTAIRDSFGTMIPLIIAGSIGLLVAAIIFGGAGSGKVSLIGLICKIANPSWSWDTVQTFGVVGNVSSTAWSKVSLIGGTMFSSMQTVTVGMMAIYFSFLLGYFLGNNRNYKHPIMVGLASLIGFLIANMGQIDFCMGAQGLISAIIFGIISSELFIWFGSMKRLEINLPEGVPPAVGKSFSVFLPMAFTAGSIAVFNIIVLAPSIVSTGWTVDTGQYKTILNSDSDFVKLFGLTWDDNKMPSQFQAYSSLLSQLKSNLNVADFQKYFSNLSVSEQSIITNFLVYQLGYTPIDKLASIDSNAIIHFASNGDSIISMTFSYQQVSVDSISFGWGEAIFKFFTSWFIGFATSGGGLGLALIYTFFCCLFWWFGIHGDNVMAAIFEPIWWMILGINSSLYLKMGWDAMSTGQMGTFAKPFFDSYKQVGPTGALLPLLFVTLIFSKRKDLKEVAKYSMPVGIFQIGEPILFGYPIVFNGRLLAPFIAAPFINVIIGWAFIDSSALGWVHPPVIATPWTAPWFLGALLASLDPKALVPAFICFILDIFIYLPFVLLDNKLYFKDLKINNPKVYDEEIKYLNDPVYRFEIKSNEKLSKFDDKRDLLEMHLSKESNEKLKDIYKNKFNKIIKKIEKLKMINNKKLNFIKIKQNKIIKEKRN